MILLLVFCSFLSGNPGSSSDLTINFGDYLEVVPSEDCSYTANGIPFHFYDVYDEGSNGGRQICEGSVELYRAFRGQVQREDLPITGKKVEVSIAEIDCQGVEQFFEYVLSYQNGKVIKSYGSSLVIQRFHKLDHLSFTEMECGLTGIESRVGPVVLEFRILR